MRTVVSFTLAAFLVAACGGEGETPPSGPAGSSSAAKSSPYALAADPGQGVPVLEAKAQAPKDEAIVVGRVRDFTEGLAGFTMIDAAVPYCGETEMEGCPTPWDYCCKSNEEISKHSILVEVRGPDGRAVRIDRLPELRNLDLVAVKGKLTKDATGDVILAATGWYRRERPNLGDHVKFN